MNAAEYYLQMILDNSRVVIITTDMDGRVVEFNKEAQKLLEYSKDEMVGRDILSLYEKSPQRSDVNKARPADTKIWESRNREVSMRSKSGRVYTVSITLSTMVNDKGEIIGTVGVGTDITEQKMLQHRLGQSEKLAGIGTLASGIAHEINNPLAGILGMAEAIRDEDDPALVKSYANDIIEYAVHAKKIVSELNAYSRSAAHEDRAAIDLHAIIDDSLKMVSHTAALKKVKTIKDLQGECRIKANKTELQQVFVNLIVNAAQAMGEKGTLTISARQTGGFVVGSVSDTGRGIPKENLNQIFDPFFTTKPAGSGTGLGLYVVYKIVTKHGGTIDVDSSENAGTTFTVKFPCCSADKTGATKAHGIQN